jgi:hypothetical protein
MTAVAAVLALVLSGVACARARRPRAGHAPAPEKSVGHAPTHGVCPGSPAGTPAEPRHTPIHTPKPAIVYGVRPDGGGTTLAIDAPALGWRSEVAELLDAYATGASPPSRVWQWRDQWGDRPCHIRPVKGGIRIEARGDCYLVITPARAVLVLLAQAVDLWGGARAWGDHWGPRAHALLFGGEPLEFAALRAAGWRGTGLHLAVDLSGIVDWPTVWMRLRKAWSGRGARTPRIELADDGRLKTAEIGDATSSPSTGKIYGKTGELEARRTKTGATLRTVWEANGWRPGDPVWRVEGGLRGKALRLRSVDLTDPEQLLSPAAWAIAWAYLFGHPQRPRSGLIRLLDPDDSRRGKDRAVHPLWSIVQFAAAVAPVITQVQIRDATEAEDDARRRRATTAVRRGLASLAVASGHDEPTAAGAHAVAAARTITRTPEWPKEVEVARVDCADLRAARTRTRDGDSQS